MKVDTLRNCFRDKSQIRLVEEALDVGTRIKSRTKADSQDFVLRNLKNQDKKESRLDAWDKCSGLVHWDDPEGWGGEGGGRGVQVGEHM